ncbi:MAG: hypothetical protein [Caudoviricetes sp.]|nr:MAG: hypothetical protein [Caudoviricetes sp.]
MLIKISAYRIESFKKVFAKLVKLAVKTNSEMPTYEIGEIAHSKKYGSYYQVDVQGVAPKYDGWTFVARIDLSEKIITGIEDFPMHYYDDNGYCEHCHTKHKRVKTYIIRKENKYMEVGGACLLQYTGGATPAQIASQFDIYNELKDCVTSDEYSDASYGSNRAYIDNLIRFIELTKKMKNKFGYVKSDNDHPTADTVWDFMTGSMSREEIQFYRAELNTEFDDEYCHKAIEYVMNTKATSSFMINLQQIMKNGFITHRSHRIAAAIVQVYDAFVDGEARRKLEKETSVSEYQGNPKDRLTLDVQVTHYRVSEGYYGVSTWIVMQDEQGNVYTWSASKLIDITVGHEFKLVGTVKEHKEYNDIKQTVLTRCKIL